MDNLLPKLSVSHPWWVLAVAIAFEVAGTTAMRLSEGFSRWLPSLLIFVFYAFSFALNTLISVFYFREPATALKMASITLIVVGVFGLHAATRSNS